MVQQVCKNSRIAHTNMINAKPSDILCRKKLVTNEVTRMYVSMYIVPSCFRVWYY